MTLANVMNGDEAYMDYDALGESRVRLERYNARAVFRRRTELVARAELFRHRLIVADPS